MDSSIATVNITIIAVNDQPVANPLTVDTTIGSSVSLTLTGSDIENNPLTYAVVTNPSHGNLTGSAPDLVFTPAAGYSGQDSFTFKV